MAAAPRISYAGNAPEFASTGEHVSRIAELGFSHVAVRLPADDGADLVSDLQAACDRNRISLLVDIGLSELAVDHPLVRKHPE